MWEWVFDGIGTELIGLLIGSVLGGFAGYKVGVSSKAKQVQKAKDHSEQKQNLNIGIHNGETDASKSCSTFFQIQKAGNDAIQVQTGDIRNE